MYQNAQVNPKSSANYIYKKKKKKHCQLQMYAYLIFGIEKFNLYMTFVFQIKRD